MYCGIVGLPYSGKTTIFNLLTGQGAAGGESARKETTRGIAKLTDARLDAVARTVQSKLVTPAAIEFVDVPGFATASATREPFPAATLAELRAVDLLALIVRDFDNPGVPPHAGSVDPKRDLERAALEFIINDLAIAEKRLERLARQRDPESRREAELLGRCQAALSNESPLRELDFKPDELKILRAYAFLSLKPLLVVLNVDEHNVGDADRRLRELVPERSMGGANAAGVAVAAGIEAEINLLDETERAPFLRDLKIQLPALDRVVDAAFRLLRLITFFTTGDRECRSWALPMGSTAVQAAREIHADIARGFIRAEVCSWDELVEAGSFVKVKEMGKLRVEGRDYIVQDGDVVHVRFNV